MCKTLLVENSTTFRRTFKDALSERFPDMVIEEAEDGPEALAKASSFRPALVFMDIRLPGENGLTLTGKIKACLPDAAVIVLTDYDLPEYRAAAFQNGADDFIAKGSLNLAEIGKILDKMISAP